MSNRTTLRAVVLLLGTLLGVAQIHAEEAFTEAPTPKAKTQQTRLDKTLRALAWPAYSFTPRYSFPDEDRSKLARTEEFVLAGERLGFLADATTTELGLSQGHESDPLNTMFGANNHIGVLGSMTAWELGFGYTSVMVPHMFEHTRYRKTAHIAAIAGGAALTGFRVKMAMQNSAFIK